MRKNIAILTGGDSEERVISLKSADVVEKHLPINRYRCFQIDFEKASWRERTTGREVDKNDFSIEIGGEKIRFAAAFVALHGAPLENGQLQGYFESVGLPYTCCDGFVSALTMNKAMTKSVLAPFGVPMAKSVLLEKSQKIDRKAIKKLGLPVFVKPNDHGSSFGVSKVKSWPALDAAIEFAFRFSDHIMIEAFMPGRELANGAFKNGGQTIALPITEIRPFDEFFTFEAKYEGRSEEITPAPLTAEQTEKVQFWTRKIYDVLGCRGFVRVDYIIDGDLPRLIEVNTVPGISEASLVPQQAVAAGFSLGQFFEIVLENALAAARG